MLFQEKQQFFTPTPGKCSKPDEKNNFWNFLHPAKIAVQYRCLTTYLSSMSKETKSAIERLLSVSSVRKDGLYVPVQIAFFTASPNTRVHITLNSIAIAGLIRAYLEQMRKSGAKNVSQTDIEKLLV